MAYCPACGSPTDGADRFCTGCGKELPARGSGTGTPATASPGSPATAPAAGSPPGPDRSGARGPDTRLALGLAAALIVVLLVAVLVVSLDGESDGDSGREAVCGLTAEFWGIVDSDEDRSELGRLLEIAQRMGDGIDDEAEAEGFDDIAENATEAAISAVYAEATGDAEGVFDALENLESLCSGSGGRG